MTVYLSLEPICGFYCFIAKCTIQNNNSEN